MSLEWAIYWITRCDAIRGMLKIIGWTLFPGWLMITAFIGVLYFCEITEGLPEEGGRVLSQMKRLWWKLMVALSLLVACLMLIPTTPQMAAIYVIPQVVRNPEVQAELKDWKEIWDEAKGWLKEQLQESQKQQETPCPQK